MNKTTLVDLLNDKVGPGWTWGGKTGEADDPFSAWTPTTIRAIDALRFRSQPLSPFLSRRGPTTPSTICCAMPFNQSGLYGSILNGTTNDPPLPDFVNFNTNGVSETQGERSFPRVPPAGAVEYGGS